MTQPLRRQEGHWGQPEGQPEAKTLFCGERTDSPASGPGSQGADEEADGGEMPAVLEAGRAVGGGGRVATSLDTELLLPAAGTVGGP